jgi:carboxylate-amine ligase
MRHESHQLAATGLDRVTIQRDRVIEDTAADAVALGCAAEINRCRAIAGAGTSADAQLAVFEAHAQSAGRDGALRAVSEWIAAATLQ